MWEPSQSLVFTDGRMVEERVAQPGGTSIMSGKERNTDSMAVQQRLDDDDGELVCAPVVVAY